MKISLFIAFALVVGSIGTGKTIAQPHTPPNLIRPGQLDEPAPPARTYPDSVEFNKVFEEFYPLVAPKEPVMQRIEQQFHKLYPMWRPRGVDSAEGWAAIQKSVDTGFDRRTIFNSYRPLLTAQDLKEYTKFLKTPAGMKVYEAQMKGNAAMLSRDLNNYAANTVSRSLQPLAKIQAPPPTIRRGPALPGTRPTPPVTIPSQGDQH